jgi:VanZ family protein
MNTINWISKSGGATAACQITEDRARFAMYRHLVLVAAWSAMGIVAYATLSRVGTVYQIYETVAPVIAQPTVAQYVHFEHLLAYAVIGLLFALAYPRNLILVSVAVFGAAIILEVLQTLTPDRHGTIPDAIEKVIGAAIGVVLGRLVMLAGQRYRKSFLS